MTGNLGLFEVYDPSVKLIGDCVKAKIFKRGMPKNRISLRLGAGVYAEPEPKCGNVFTQPLPKRPNISFSCLLYS